MSAQTRTQPAAEPAAQILHIVDRRRPNPAAWVSLQDFTVAAGERLPAATAVRDPHTSLYCLDMDQRRFIFVQTDPGVDLSQHPFFFQAQFEQARRLIAVPFEALHQLAAAAAPNGRLANGRLPNGRSLILLYSVGRCGSTLLSELFNQQPDVASLSEPDVFTQIQKMRVADGSRDDELRQLLRSSLFALMKPLPPKRPSHWAIKFRSFAVELADLIYDVAPEATVLFMYRNAVDWATSTTRAFKKLESAHNSVGTRAEREWQRRSQHLRRAATAVLGPTLPAPLESVVRRAENRAGVLSPQSLQLRTRLFPALQPYLPRLKQGDLTRGQYITLEWISGMSRCLALQQQGVPVTPLRYEDLLAQPYEMVHTLFGLCRLPAPPEAQITAVLGRDSQRGTSLAQTAVRGDAKNRLDAGHLAEMQALLREHPRLQDPHVILPNTLLQQRSANGEQLLRESA